jgi:hypothetical protein
MLAFRSVGIACVFGTNNKHLIRVPLDFHLTRRKRRAQQTASPPPPPPPPLRPTSPLLPPREPRARATI